MWRVTKDAKSAYLLAITHNGTAVEHDDYLEEVIEPAFKKSDTFRYESVNFYIGKDTRCVDFASTQEEINHSPIITQARALAASGYADILRNGQNNSGNPPWSGDIDKFAADTVAGWSDFDLFWAIFINKFGLKASVPSGSHSKWSPIVDDLLLSLNEKDKKNQRTSDNPERINFLLRAGDDHAIESQADIVSAYCAVKGQRWNILSEAIKKLSTDQQFMLDTTFRDSIISTESDDFRALLQSGGNIEFTDVRQQSSTLVEFLLCNRSHSWVKSINGLLEKYNQPFIALGVAHFFDIRREDLKCGGLLSDLQQDGFQIELVK